MTVHGVINPFRFGFNPITAVGWTDAYWAEGPNFKALGYANGASVTSWPNEIAGNSGALAKNAGTDPVYASSVAAFNSKPTVNTLAATVYMLAATPTTLTQPWTVVAIYSRTGGNTAPAIAGAQSAASSDIGLRKSDFCTGGGTAITWTGADGPALLEGFASGASSAVYLNGTSVATGNPGANSVTIRTVFARTTVPSSPLTGHIAFVGFKAGALTTVERAALLAWSKSYYGTP